MRIIIVSPSLNYGGAERVASIWANTFVQKGNDVFFVTNLQNGYEYSLDERINLLPLTPIKGGKLIRYITAITNLRQYYRTYHPDVVIGVMWVCSLLAKLASFGKDIPVVATEHNAFERPQGSPMSFKDRFAKFYLNYLYNYVTVLTNSDYEIVKNRFKKVSVMPNPLLLQPAKDVPPKEKVVLAAGRLDAWHYKGFDVLIHAWARIVSSFKFLVSTDGWKLQIAGTGSEESLNYLKRLCKENGVEDSVEFLGFRKDVEKLYQDASIFVLSSRYEGFGLVLIEAMSQGCACVACDYKGRQREIIAPLEKSEQSSNCQFETCDNGVLCEPDNVEALANAMAKMIIDDDYRERVRMNAIERSKYYSIENTMYRWEALLSSLQRKRR